MKVADYSFSRPNLGTLKASGFVGVARYLCPLPNSKALSASELRGIHDAGLSVCVVWESTANRAGQGFGAGESDALAANAQADTLGLERDCTIYFAVDFETDAAVIRPYFDGARSVARRPTGAYGSFRVVEGLFDWKLIDKGWQTAAWSYGKKSSRAALYQYGFHDTYDENEVLQLDWGQSPRPSQKPPDPIPLPEDVMFRLMRPSDSPTVFIVNGSSRVAVPDQFFLGDFANRFRSQILPPSVGGPTTKIETTNGVQVEVVNPNFLHPIPVVKP